MKLSRACQLTFVAAFCVAVPKVRGSTESGDSGYNNITIDSSLRDVRKNQLDLTVIESTYPLLALVLYSRSGGPLSFSLPDTSRILSHAWFNSRQPTVLYVFGFAENLTSPSVKAVTEAYATHSSHNILVLDWSAYSGKVAPDDYQTAIGHMGSIGGLVGRRLVSTFGSLMLRRFHLVGYSLGAHLAAKVNRAIPVSLFAGRIPKIIGLDPAGPYLYTTHLNHEPLGPSDAKIVQVIHTDMRGAGAPRNTGTMDFYPNGGGITGVQPGCPIKDDSDTFAAPNFCSHTRSVAYYVESIKSPDTDTFLVVRCASYADFLFGRCASTNQKMGFHANGHEVGEFYLQTNSFAPYGRGHAGTVYSFKAP